MLAVARFGFRKVRTMTWQDGAAHEVLRLHCKLLEALHDVSHALQTPRLQYKDIVRNPVNGKMSGTIRIDRLRAFS